MTVIAHSITNALRSGGLALDDVLDSRVAPPRRLTVRRDRLEDLPSPLAVLRMTGEAIRGEERLDRLGGSGGQGSIAIDMREDNVSRVQFYPVTVDCQGACTISGVNPLPQRYQYHRTTVDT